MHLRRLPFMLKRSAFLGLIGLMTVQATVVQAQKAPSITSISPTSAVAGGPAFTLTVLGKGFTSTCKIRWNGFDRTTTFSSTTKLLASIPVSDIQTTGTASVTVQKPSSPLSNAKTFTITSPPPVADPAIAFTRGGSLRVMNADGSNQTSLTSYTVGRPAFSPDGMRIAFMAGSGAPQGAGLYTMNRDGANLNRVRPINYFFSLSASVDWASMPDGVDRIAYIDQDGFGSDYHVLLTNLAGTELLVVASPNGGGGCTSPTFSADGKTLYYLGYSGPSGSISGDIIGVRYEGTLGNLVEVGRDSWVYGVADSALRSMTTSADPLFFSSIAASRTGRKIVIGAHRLSNSLLAQDMFVLDLDNPTAVTQLTNTSSVSEEWPAWSPDGAKIAFSTKIGSYWTIATMLSTGGAVTNLSNNATSLNHYQPYWRR